MPGSDFSPSMRAAVLGVIPARIGSTRLPRKPLHDLAGRPLIEWVWHRVKESGVCDRVVVATDSEAVAERATGFGAEAMLTAPDHPSGTDRVAEVVRRLDAGPDTTVLNVQGDEPFVDPSHLQAAVDLVTSAGWPVGTLATPLRSMETWRDPDAVKVVRGSDGRALYFSRAPVPFVRDGAPADDDLARPPFLRHLGLYAYTAEALARWVALPESALERLERLEQLRPLEAGIGIGVAVVQEAERGVDTPEDAARAARLLADRQGSAHTGTHAQAEA
jgi:3-deoxy-manno-octulosonate cytidylyltransferase (CMP-KDO synthetase)